MVNVTVAESADCAYTCHRPSSPYSQDHTQALQKHTHTQEETEHTNTACLLFLSFLLRLSLLSFLTVSHLALTLESETIPLKPLILLHHHLFLPLLTVCKWTQIWSKHTDIAAPVTLYQVLLDTHVLLRQPMRVSGGVKCVWRGLA